MTAGSTIKRRDLRSAMLGFLVFVCLPTALGAAYYAVIAADRYVTEFRYSVRGGAMSTSGDLGGIGASAGLVFAADSFVLYDYLTSVEALINLEGSLPLREMLARDGDDPVRRFDPTAPVERVLPFWKAAVRPRFDPVTGITRVQVSLFTPEDAARVGEALVAELRRIVDGLSAEARTAMLAYVNDEYERAVLDLDRARAALEAFRRDNRIISPDEQVTIGQDIIASLSGKLTELRVEMRTLRQRAQNSPRIPTIEREIRSLEEQLNAEFARRGGKAGETALPGQITSFDELENAYEVARDSFVSTLQLKQQAEANATLSQVELVVFVQPRKAVASTEPVRWLATLQVFAISLLVWVVGKILFASLAPA